MWPTGAVLELGTRSGCCCVRVASGGSTACRPGPTHSAPAGPWVLGPCPVASRPRVQAGGPLHQPPVGLEREGGRTEGKTQYGDW